MDKQLIKILILFLAASFLPASVFGFFAQPDPYIHSMPFGVQENYSGDVKITLPPASQLLQTPQTPANNNSSPNSLPVENPQNLTGFNWLLFLTFILIAIAVYFIIRAIIKHA